MRQTSRDNTKRTEKSLVEHLHASLVKHEVITDKRVIECGEDYLDIRIFLQRVHIWEFKTQMQS